MAVFLTEDDRAGDREKLGLAEEVFEALIDVVPVVLLEAVLDGTMEREPLGQLDDVFEELTDPVVVLEEVVVFVAVVVDVIVLVTIAVSVILGLVLDVLEAAALRESSRVAFMLFVDVVLGVKSRVGGLLLVAVVVLVDVFEEVGLRVGTTFESMSRREL